MPTSTNASRAVGEGFPRAFVVTSAELLTLLDFFGLLLAGSLTQQWLWSLWTAQADSPGVAWSVRFLLVVAALLAAIDPPRPAVRRARAARGLVRADTFLRQSFSAIRGRGARHR